MLIDLSVRNDDQFRRPLLTLWTAAWCGTVSPLIKSLVGSGVGEAEGGVGYCEVEFDAPDVNDRRAGPHLHD
jgi:hypothetical protein